MRDGVLVTPLTPRCSFTVAVESAARAGSLMAGSWRQVKLSSRRLLTLRFVRGGVSGFRAFYHPAENHKFALRKERGEAAERTSPDALRSRGTPSP